MKTLFNHFNGRLAFWLKQWYFLRKYQQCDLLNDHQEFSLLMREISNTIKEARLSGANWLFSLDDIEERSTKEFTLPSVDMTEYFELESNNKLKEFFQQQGYGHLAEKIKWDTESSAWYPMFRTREVAEETISTLNAIFDKHFVNTK
jgi:hypothetical protein